MMFITVLILALILYLLFSPITFEVKNGKGQGGGPLLRARIFPFGFVEFGGKVKPSKREKIPVSKPKTIKKNIDLFLYILADTQLLKKVIIEVIRFGYRILKVPGKYSVRLSLAGGLAEPHLTGQLFGVICAIESVLPDSVDIRYDPDFTHDTIKAEFQIEIKICLATAIFELIRFILNLPLIRIAKFIWGYRKESQYAYQN